MKITFKKYIPDEMTLEDFADKHNLEMVVTEFPPEHYEYEDQRYYANFKDVRVINGDMELSIFGNGSTPEHAIAAYCHKIQGKLVKLDFKTTIKVPKFLK